MSNIRYLQYAGIIIEGSLPFKCAFSEIDNLALYFLLLGLLRGAGVEPFITLHDISFSPDLVLLEKGLCDSSRVTIEIVLSLEAALLHSPILAHG
jgi:hypothetical protein